VGKAEAAGAASAKALGFLLAFTEALIARRECKRERAREPAAASETGLRPPSGGATNGDAPPGILPAFATVEVLVPAGAEEPEPAAPEPDRSGSDATTPREPPPEEGGGAGADTAGPAGAAGGAGEEESESDKQSEEAWLGAWEKRGEAVDAMAATFADWRKQLRYVLAQEPAAMAKAVGKMRGAVGKAEAAGAASAKALGFLLAFTEALIARRECKRERERARTSAGGPKEEGPLSQGWA
jgi:hypothetical protein